MEFLALYPSRYVRFLRIRALHFSDQHAAADYLIVLIGRTLIARFMGHDIYRATSFDILPLGDVSTDVPPHPVEAHLLALVRSHLRGGNFLFSYTWDLTRCLQSQWQSTETDAGKAFWEVVRELFLIRLPLIDAGRPGRRSVFLEQVYFCPVSQYVRLTCPKVLANKIHRFSIDEFQFRCESRLDA